MKFSLMFFASGEADVERNKYKLVIEGAKFADQHDFSSVWVPERHFTSMGCLYPNPAVLHAALARETHQIRLHAGSVVAPLHHPIRIAEEWSVVDNLSDGRVGLSFASGWNPADFTFFPERYKERHQEMYGLIETVQKLWRGDSIEITDGTGKRTQVRIYPTPIQKELPFWVTAASNPKTFQKAGQIGANVLTHMFNSSVEQLAEKIQLYREARAENGHDVKTGQVTVMLHTFVGENIDDVHEKVREPYCQYLASNVGLATGFAASRGREVDLSELSPEESKEFFNFVYDRFATSRALIGTPETCLDLLSRLEQIGVTEIASLLDFGPEVELILSHLPYLEQLKERYNGQSATAMRLVRPDIKDETIKEEAVKVESNINRVESLPAPPVLPSLSLSNILSRCSEKISRADFYARLQQSGIELDGAYQGIEQLWRGEGEALAEIKLPTELESKQGRYSIHPAFLDACLQLFPAMLAEPSNESIYMPSGLGTMRVHGPIGQHIWSHAQLKRIEEQLVEGDITLYDANQRLVAEIRGFRLQGLQTEASEERWLDWLYKVEWQPRAIFGLSPDYWPALEEVNEELATSLAGLLAETTTLQRQAQGLQEMEAVSLDYVLMMLQQHGLRFRLGEEWSTEQIAQQLAVIPPYRRLLERLLDMLAEEGILLQQDIEGTARWRVVRLPERREPNMVMQQLKKDYGAVIGAGLTLLKRCAERLGQVIQGKQDAVQLLFPDGDFSTVNELYENSPAAAVMNRLVRDSVLNAIADLPAERGIRLLEIGAGTGGTTSWLLPHLPPTQTEYLFTDISSAFMAKAQEKFADYEFMAYQALDIEQSPLTQGVRAHQYDIIIAANVLHATRNLRDTLTHVRQLLAPGGRLILLEGTIRSRWVDLTFGLTDGWWRFADHRRGHPLLSAPQWQELLLECGFEQAIFTPHNSSDTKQLGQAVIVAQAGHEKVSSTDSASQVAPKWLLFADEMGMSDALAAPWREQGEEVVLVYAGDEYREHDQGRQFTINPQQAADYERLFASVPNLAGVVHLWSLNRLTSQTIDLPQTFSQGCGSLLLMTQALLRLNNPPPCLWLVTRAAQAVEERDHVAGLAHASLWGMARVITFEHPELPLIRLDLDGEEPLTEQAMRLYAQINAPSAFEPPEDQVALRNGRRYVARLVPSTPPSTARPLAAVGRLCDAEGTYLITGGLGGLGLFVAQWLVEQGAGHLLLMGRSEPNAKQREQIQALREMGAKVTVAQADVTNRTQMENLLKKIDEAAPLRGILHMANVVEMDLVLNQTWDRVKSTLAPKAVGAWNLHLLTEEMPLDFFVLFSSRASLLPYRGLASYAAANAFLDAFAHYRHKQGMPALTINWGTWSEFGQMAKLIDQEPQRLAAGEQILPPQQAMQAFAYLLAQQEIQVGVMPNDWNEFLRAQERPWPFFTDLAPSFGSQSDEPASEQVTDRLEEIRQASDAEQDALINQHLLSLAANVFSSSPEEIDPQQGLVRLGLDSLMAVELRNQIRTDLHVEIPIVDFLEGISISGLTAIIREQLATAKDGAEGASGAIDIDIDIDNKTMQDQATQVMSLISLDTTDSTSDTEEWIEFEL